MQNRDTIEPGTKIIVKVRGESLSRCNNKGVVTRVFSGREHAVPKVEYRSYKTGNLYVVSLDSIRPDVAKRLRRAKRARFITDNRVSDTGDSECEEE